MTWYRRLVARKFDGSRAHRRPGRPPIDKEVEELIVGMAKENRSWGYDRIVGALANLGYRVSDQTVGNVLRRHGIAPTPERKRTRTWAEFILNPGVGAIPWGGHQPERVSFMPAAGAGEAAVGGLAGTLLGRD
jgi:Homeodomain-like domain